jgi:hypothetical protein
VQRAHDKLALNRKELAAELSDLKDKAVTTGPGGMVDVDAMAAQKKANGRPEDMFDVPLHKANSRINIINMSLTKAEKGVSTAATAMYNLTEVIKAFEKNLGTLLGGESWAAAAAAAAEEGPGGARKGAAGARAGAKFGGVPSGAGAGRVGRSASGGDLTAAAARAGGARGARVSALKAENSTASAARGDAVGGDNPEVAAEVDLNKQANAYLRDLANFFTVLDQANIVAAADAHMAKLAENGGDVGGHGSGGLYELNPVDP